MLDTRMRLDSAEDKEGHILNAYRVYQFQFAVTILHEIGHVFNTYLSKGIGDTPPSPGGTVEAGFRLEKLIFGEKIHFLRDRKAGDSDCGVCPSTIVSAQGQLFRVTDVRYRPGGPLSNGKPTKMSLTTTKSQRKQLTTSLI